MSSAAVILTDRMASESIRTQRLFLYSVEGAEAVKVTVDGEPLDIQRYTAQAMSSRREVETALRADHGYDGHFVVLDQECPRCAAAGAKTSGGSTPRLRARIPDGSLGYAVVCQTHGEIDGEAE